MKKFVTILLICVYALATMGFSLREFYCCGKLSSKSVTFISNENEKCAKGNNNDDWCCKYKYQYFKVKDNHVSAGHIHLLAFNHRFNLPLYKLSLQDLIFSSQENTFGYTSNAPPLCYSVPIYISNCVYLI